MFIDGVIIHDNDITYYSQPIYLSIYRNLEILVANLSSIEAFIDVSYIPTLFLPKLYGPIVGKMRREWSDTHIMHIHWAMKKFIIEPKSTFVCELIRDKYDFISVVN